MRMVKKYGDLEEKECCVIGISDIVTDGKSYTKKCREIPAVLPYIFQQLFAYIRLRNAFFSFIDSIKCGLLYKILVSRNYTKKRKNIYNHSTAGIARFFRLPYFLIQL